MGKREDFGGSAVSLFRIGDLDFFLAKSYIWNYNQDMKICVVEGCGKPYKARGGCQKHYSWYMYHTPERKAKRESLKSKAVQTRARLKFMSNEDNRERTRLNKAKYDKSPKGIARRERGSKRRIERLSQQTPPWADLVAITKFYTHCPKGFQVDHIIPLAGKEVSGLHVMENLQYLTPEQNMKKSIAFLK